MLLTAPTLSKIHRCLQKMLEEQRPQRITILPLWPTQVWWPELLKMLIAIPFVLPKQEDLLSLNPLRRRLTTLYGGMPPAWQSIQDREVSEAAAKLLMASWRNGTKK